MVYVGCSQTEGYCRTVAPVFPLFRLGTEITDQTGPLEDAIHTPQMGCLHAGGVQTPGKLEMEVCYIGNVGISQWPFSLWPIAVEWGEYSWAEGDSCAHFNVPV